MVRPPPAERRVGDEAEHHAGGQEAIEEGHPCLRPERLRAELHADAALRCCEDEHDERGHREIEDTEGRLIRPKALHDRPCDAHDEHGGQDEERDGHQPKGTAGDPVGSAVGMPEVPHHDQRSEHLDHRIEAERDEGERTCSKSETDRDEDLDDVPPDRRVLEDEAPAFEQAPVRWGRWLRGSFDHGAGDGSSDRPRADRVADRV